MKYLNLVVVLSLIAATSGLSLGALNKVTFETIQNNILKFKKVPAVADIQEAVTGPTTAEERVAIEEALLANKRFVDRDGQEPLLFFVVDKADAPHALVIEGFGGGFGGDIGVMVGFELQTGNLAGIGITTLSETPGLGTHVRDAIFREQFSGMAADSVFKVKKDGGDIDAITGATLSSRGVAAAITQAQVLYQDNKEHIGHALNSADEVAP
ncbi:MAG: FMN-binding protein [Proteobacteria bacterium]|jgi:Na+-translocating ferredoxin:NAD+ oxidoreductase subunit G|nr:FMN-binding protein [Pseudomonadota bacterium]